MSIKRMTKILIGLVILISVFLFVQTVLAQVEPGINVVGEEIALPEEDPRIIAARIIRAALGFLGIIALAIILYGGFIWMTAAGVPERIDKAKKILINGVIGLIIIICAFGITQFVLNKLMEAAGVGPPAPPAGPPVVEGLSGSLGNGIIESHYPPRGAVGIPRNVKVIVTFKEPMLLKSIINNYDDNDTPQDLTDDTVIKNDNGTTTVTDEMPDPTVDDWMEVNAENIKIYKSIDGEEAVLASNQVRVNFTDNLEIFVFDPIDLLGSPSENIWYTVGLKEGVKKADGEDAFTGAFSEGYLWDFEVSTFVDTTPPQVESTVPEHMDLDEFERCLAGGRTRTECGAWARNVLIQVNFDEAMDPTTVSGETKLVERDGIMIIDPLSFDKIEVLANGNPVAGTWSIANQYKTVEFTTDDDCGINSCGGTVYCLPEDKTIVVLIKAATLGDTPPEAEWPYDGIVDVVGNSLDGNRDNAAQGPPTDNHEWSFPTSDTIDLIPPEITDVVPGPGTGSVEFNVLVEMIFSKIMSKSSFNTENIVLEDNQRDECAVWFTLGGVNLKEVDGRLEPVTSPDDIAVNTKAQIHHGNFIPTGGTCADGAVVNPETVFYYPRATSDVKDIFQNCFFRPEGPGSPPGAWECIEGEPGCPSPLPWE